MHLQSSESLHSSLSDTTITTIPDSTGHSAKTQTADGIPPIDNELWRALALDCLICLLFWIGICNGLIACYLAWTDLLTYQHTP